MNTNNNLNEFIKIQSKTKYFIFLCLYFFLYPICFILFGRKNNWLLCERGIDAQDNGYFFYKYLRENHPEINVVYIIKKNSPDFRKIASLGRVVEFGSIKHFLMMIGYPVKISSQLYGYSPWVQSTLYYRRHKTHHKHIFLQHGIIKNLHQGLFSDVCKSLNLFVCGAEPEYHFIVDEFKYHNEVPQYTGLPRYDYLDDSKCSKQILFMPTWRVLLSGATDEAFLKSTFYKNWNQLINNHTLSEFCIKNGIIIKFYLHHCMQPYSHLFKSNNVVKVIMFGEEDVQKLLKESLLLITDFSSVYFDFAYMHKPMIYFQFDEISFNNEHYAKGYFDYRKNGFGDVVTTIDDLEKSFINLASHNFAMPDKYKIRTNSFFTIEKGHNCERVFQRISTITQ